jgi:hypothetical protein
MGFAQGLPKHRAGFADPRSDRFVLSSNVAAPIGSESEAPHRRPAATMRVRPKGRSLKASNMVRPGSAVTEKQAAQRKSSGSPWKCVSGQYSRHPSLSQFCVNGAEPYVLIRSIAIASKTYRETPYY